MRARSASAAFTPASAAATAARSGRVVETHHHGPRLHPLPFLVGQLGHRGRHAGRERGALAGLHRARNGDLARAARADDLRGRDVPRRDRRGASAAFGGSCRPHAAAPQRQRSSGSSHHARLIVRSPPRRAEAPHPPWPPRTRPRSPKAPRRARPSPSPARRSASPCPPCGAPGRRAAPRDPPRRRRLAAACRSRAVTARRYASATSRRTWSAAARASCSAARCSRVRRRLALAAARRRTASSCRPTPTAHACAPSPGRMRLSQTWPKAPMSGQQALRLVLRRTPRPRRSCAGPPRAPAAGAGPAPPTAPPRPSSAPTAGRRLGRDVARPRRARRAAARGRPAPSRCWLRALGQVGLALRAAAPARAAGRPAAHRPPAPAPRSPPRAPSPPPAPSRSRRRAARHLRLPVSLDDAHPDLLRRVAAARLRRRRRGGSSRRPSCPPCRTRRSASRAARCVPEVVERGGVVQEGGVEVGRGELRPSSACSRTRRPAGPCATRSAGHAEPRPAHAPHRLGARGLRLDRAPAACSSGLSFSASASASSSVSGRSSARASPHAGQQGRAAARRATTPHLRRLSARAPGGRGAPLAVAARRALRARAAHAAADRVADAAHVRVRDAVVDPRALAPRRHEAGVDHLLQVLRHVRLAAAGRLHQLRHAALALLQRGEQRQPGRLAERLEPLRDQRDQLGRRSSGSLPAAVIRRHPSICIFAYAHICVKRLATPVARSSRGVARCEQGDPPRHATPMVQSALCQ